MRYEQIKPLLDEEILDEVKMSPSALQKFARSPEAEGMLMGVEFEMGVPNVGDIDPEPEWEYDYDQNERARSIDNIIDFFRSGEFSNMSSREADRAREEMYSQYEDWYTEQIRGSSQIKELIAEKLRENVTPDMFEDEAREELGDDASDEDVNERAIELADEVIEQHMRDNSGQYWDGAEEEALEEAYDDWRDDGDFDEEAWLSDIGVDDMQDAEREWSFDWPHMYDSNYGEGEADLDTIADEFSQAMGGVKVNTSSNYHGATRDGRSWIIEPDGSIDADRGDAGLEFVSPPMPLADGLEMIQRFYAWAKKEGCYTNDSTGLHMNISVPDLTIEKLDYVKLALFLGDEYVLKQFGRQYNSYAKSAMSKIKDRIRPEDVPSVLATMKEHLNSMASKTIHSGITDKYTSINTKSNYVEFRGPGGDYLDQDPMELVNTALRAALSLRIASDPEAYKQEYAKKLYKLVEQSGGEDDSVKLFSQYALGELNKDELVARVKFAQRGRQIEKGKRDSVTRMIDDPQVKQKVNDLPTAWRNMLRDDVPTTSEQELQGIIDSINSGREDNWLNPEQRELVVAIINNELAVRRAEGDKKQYWVSNRNGEGGKQMVYAHNENEAILIGGKNIGLNREQSIARLQASERVERTPEQMLASLPEDWREFYNKIDDASMGVLRGGLDSMTTGRWQYRNLDDDQVDFIKSAIETAMRSRQEQGEGGLDRKRYPFQLRAMIEAMPAVVKDWLLNIPNKSEQILRDAYTAVQNRTWGRDLGLTQEQLNIAFNLITDELSYRSATGTEQEDGTIELQFKDGESSTPVSNWDTWVRNIQSHETVTLDNVARMMRQGGEPVRSLTDSDREYIQAQIRSELNRRGGEENTALDHNVLDTLPDMFKHWLQNIGDHSDMGLINTLNNTRTYTDLNDQQAAYFRIRIKRELRRRGINPDTAAPSPANPYADDAAERERMRREREQLAVNMSSPDDESITDIMGNGEEEQDTNAAAAQQAQLINRDDPVTSNDPEAQSPIAQDGPGMWMVGNHTYGRETFRANSRDEAIQAYAERNGITVQDLTSDRSFVAQLTQPDQGELDLREMRRLAGLI